MGKDQEWMELDEEALAPYIAALNADEEEEKKTQMED